MQTFDYVIVGGGMAADAAVAGIRRRDRKGSILVISEELFPPYQRPPLSKKLWMDMRLEDTFLRGFERHSATLALASRVVRINREARQIEVADGRAFQYGKLLLALGAAPRTVSSSSKEVYYVGSVAEHIRLWKALGETRSVLVVGGGFIGAEMTAALSARGHHVTWLVLEAYPFANFFPKSLAQHVLEEYTKQGVTVLAGEEVTAIEDGSGGVSAKTVSGRIITADLAVLGIGVAPNDQLAKDAGLATGHGVPVDQFLRTSDPYIWAAGDVAVMAPDGRPMMHEDHAVTQGRAAGENMAGAEKPYTHVPFYYSDLYHFGYEAVGDCNAKYEMVEDWVVPGDEGVIYYLSEGQVVGVLNWNVWDKVDAATELLSSGQRYNPDQLVGRIRNS